MNECCANCKNCVSESIGDIGTAWYCRYKYLEIDDPYYDNCPQYAKGPATALLSGSED